MTISPAFTPSSAKPQRQLQSDTRKQSTANNESNVTNFNTFDPTCALDSLLSFDSLRQEHAELPESSELSLHNNSAILPSFRLSTRSSSRLLRRTQPDEETEALSATEEGSNHGEGSRDLHSILLDALREVSRELDEEAIASTQLFDHIFRDHCPLGEAEDSTGLLPENPILLPTGSSLDTILNQSVEDWRIAAVDDDCGGSLDSLKYYQGRSTTT